jgi:hypothetical protein
MKRFPFHSGCDLFRSVARLGAGGQPALTAGYHDYSLNAIDLQTGQVAATETLARRYQCRPILERLPSSKSE